MSQHLYTFPPTLGNEAAQGQHYMLLDSYESKSAIDTTGLRKSSIALFIPPNALSTTIQQNYEDKAGGALMAQVGGGMQTLNWSSMVAQAVKFAVGSGEAAQGIVARQQAVGTFLSAGFGLAKNNHMAMVYRGPSAFREHQFQFDFFPKNEPEAKTIRSILKDFQDGSTPRTVDITNSEAQKLTAPFFKSPRHWKIKFMMGSTGVDRGPDKDQDYSSGNPYLHTFKPSVITSMAVNHDPSSIVGFHKDGSPVQTRLSLTFKELEYITSGDGLSDDEKKTVEYFSGGGEQEMQAEKRLSFLNTGDGPER